MSVGLAASIRDAEMQALADLIDSGPGAGRLRIYGGSRPATGLAPGLATLLADIELPKPCGSVALGQLVFASVLDGAGVADGNATWARFVNSAGAFAADVSAGGVGSGAIVQLQSPTISNGQTVRVVSGVLTEGNP